MLDSLRALAATAARASHVPYSGRAAGAALGLADGRTVAAPRLENASYPLTIPALQGALGLALAAGSPPVALAATRDPTDAGLALLAEATGRAWSRLAPDAASCAAPPAARGSATFALAAAPSSDTHGLGAALEASARAVVPVSAFRVGAVLADASGRAVWGANVEHEADWTRGLCAERVALVAARAAGLGPIAAVWVACAQAPGGSPCGGCRQVLAELAPGARVVLWAGDAAPVVMTPERLLPAGFSRTDLGR